MKVLSKEQKANDKTWEKNNIQRAKRDVSDSEGEPGTCGAMEDTEAPLMQD